MMTGAAARPAPSTGGRLTIATGFRTHESGEERGPRPAPPLGLKGGTTGGQPALCNGCNPIPIQSVSCLSFCRPQLVRKIGSVCPVTDETIGGLGWGSGCPRRGGGEQQRSTMIGEPNSGAGWAMALAGCTVICTHTERRSGEGGGGAGPLVENSGRGSLRRSKRTGWLGKKLGWHILPRSSCQKYMIMVVDG